MEEVEHESTMENLYKWKGMRWNISPGEKDEKPCLYFLKKE